MKQLTLRGFDAELERELRALAEELSISLNKAALLLMRRGAGLARPASRADDAPELKGPIGNSLDKFFGVWSEEEARELLDAVEIFEEIDDELWG